ncbi:homeobox-domain-containing protein [Rhizopus microsporus var. microsporus]|uniref:Homeobox-domain-containing protein n=2 Tax=Rhizopus microsporus TaxID=58291 RepID=A0A2G4T753_RHIZD|nr:homeobox-domain-containing protein [Rhizopus microsporus ATCC 52813]ORE03212.1 homeobox-domain-containing protein [Rhizopus microsporus var. microsporus]PHZ16828.1 homeobox-domain-containing protein [Rhizopus microsporus ATCC 52813]
MTSLSNMLAQQNYKRPPMLDISFLLNDDHEPERSPSLSPSLTASPASVSSTYSSYSFPQQDYWEQSKESGPIKAKRRRANSEQLEVLNRVFDRTFFPSTQMRAELGRQLGMNPRTVQIWFQNRRQAMRTKERQRLIKLRNETKLKSV